MTDTFEEFCDLSGQDIDDMDAGITILTNSASQRAVIRDVVITASDSSLPISSSAFELRQGTTVLYSGWATGRFSGTEIIDVSETIKLYGAPLPEGLLNSAVAIGGTGSSTDFDFTTVFSTPLPTGGDIGTVTQTDDSHSPWAVTPGFYCEDAAGDGYFCAGEDDGATLYRIVGGHASGNTPTSEGTIGCAVAYDHDNDIIYGMTAANTVVKYVCSTHTRTTHTVSLFSATLLQQEAVASVADGYYYVYTGINDNDFFRIDPSDWSDIALSDPSGGPYNNTGDQRCMVAQIRTDGDICLLVGDEDTGQTLYHWGVYDAADGTRLDYGTYDDTGDDLITTTAGSVNTGYKVDETIPWVFVQSYDGTYMGLGAINADAPEGGHVLLSIDAGTSLASEPMFLKRDDTQVVSDAGTISVRATGVRIT